MKVIIDGFNYVKEPIKPKSSGFLAALEVRFDSDAGEDLTIRDYLRELLETLWKEGEGFSGKRPFGNSGWEYDLYRPLIRNKFIKGELDSDGYVSEVDTEEAEKYVFNLIRACFNGVEK